MARSLNRVQLIGNLTRDPELRYTPSGTAVCSFGLATNRSWTTDTGEKHEEAEFHNIVSWNKLAELCSQFLVKGRKVYVEGRLSTRSWQGQDGQQRNRTEVVIDDMILLDSRRVGEETSASAAAPTEDAAVPQPAKKSVPKQPAAASKSQSEDPQKEEKTDDPVQKEEEVLADDIPF